MFKIATEFGAAATLSNSDDVGASVCAVDFCVLDIYLIDLKAVSD